MATISAPAAMLANAVMMNNRGLAGPSAAGLVDGWPAAPSVCAPSAAGSLPAADLSAATSVAVRSMVGGRRRGVLSGSLVMRSSGAAPNRLMGHGQPPRHSTGQRLRQQIRPRQ